MLQQPYHPWTLRSIIIIALLAVSGLDIPAILGWTTTPQQLSLSSSSSPPPLRNIFSSTTRRGTSMASSSSAIDDTTSIDKTLPFRVLGVCGGIGSGKSTACKLLVDSCFCLVHIDADKVAHSVYAPGSQAVRDVVTEFGTDILVVPNDNGDETKTAPMEIDRKKLGAIVFAERSAMAKLEAIVWPHVKYRLVEQINDLRESWYASNNATDDSESPTETKAKSKTTPVVVVEAAILLDAGWDDLLDGVWAVTVPREHALQRLVETRGLSREEAQKRIDAQESRRGCSGLEQEVEISAVQCVVSNDGTLDDLKTILRASLDDPGCWKTTPRD